MKSYIYFCQIFLLTGPLFQRGRMSHFRQKYINILKDEKESVAKYNKSVKILEEVKLRTYHYSRVFWCSVFKHSAYPHNIIAVTLIKCRARKFIAEREEFFCEYLL